MKYARAQSTYFRRTIWLDESDTFLGESRKKFLVQDAVLLGHNLMGL